MFRSKSKVSGNSNNLAGGIPSILSADMTVTGDIVSEGLVDIDGKINGNVRCQTVSIRKHGVIKGDVVADNVHVYGTVQGMIKAKSVQFFKGCRVEGTIVHETLAIEDGALVDGRFKRVEKLELDEAVPEAPVVAAVEMPVVKIDLTAVEKKSEPKVKAEVKETTAKEKRNFKVQIENLKLQNAPSFLSETAEDASASMHGDGATLSFNASEEPAKDEKPEPRVRVLENLRLIGDAS